MTLVVDLLRGRPQVARPHAQAERDVLEHAHVLEQRVVLEHEADLPLTRLAPRHVLAVEQDRGCGRRHPESPARR